MKNIFKAILGISLATSLALSTSTASAEGFYIGAGAYKSSIDSNLFRKFVSTNYYLGVKKKNVNT
ncbi:MAG TPA: hypothetical protein EYP76_02395 [Thiomicrorhabdus sp.]|nr:hypothetical protein [Thiomicrorhabdus sp.]